MLCAFIGDSHKVTAHFKLYTVIKIVIRASYSCHSCLAGHLKGLSALYTSFSVMSLMFPYYLHTSFQILQDPLIHSLYSITLQDICFQLLFSSWGAFSMGLLVILCVFYTYQDTEINMISHDILQVKVLGK